MLLQAQSLTTTHLSPSPSLSKPTSRNGFSPQKSVSFRTRTPFEAIKCSAATEERTHVALSSVKPFPAEVSRTIMELSSKGTLSTLTEDGWPLGVGVRFAVDPNGTPVLCLNGSDGQFPVDRRSSLNVQLEQCGLRTPQCTIQGCIVKPEDRMFLMRLRSAWTKRFGEEVEEDLLYYVAVERVLQIEDFKEDGIWVSSSEYKSASPDPLRDSAESIVNVINTNNMDDVHRFCNVYVDLDFLVSEAKVIWVDRLGFDVRISSSERGIFEVRIPFPREVTDEKGAKSSFNCMSQLAWEVEKHFQVPDFEKVKQLKQIS
ncbi:glutamyl-tRNA reductase-binding protein, chloroplastic [Punica granatum]|uniref:DUF2470 domain-containing protein n=2 Tax=Punica granatum TaxID=22663 RepID=A0A218WAG5_PUNGR|nr:glutamyl-tRNA reductase-binding protein, chloroplastic [Punica granatum]OWM69523.1 hypothetical protein CDL15_Pgr013984 [Punica granatum]PKI38152.1 hypothetical protein CRG98_041405 [Punica granatum]